jgi:murein tripeptide amidase MpaA
VPSGDFVFISQNFDAGNIEVIACDDPSSIRLQIRNDAHSDFYQWFYFRLSGVRGTRCHLEILNAAGAAYPPGFSDYRVTYSYDRQNWRRHPTTLRDGILHIDFTPDQDAVYFAYFAPYSMERHHDLIARSLLSPRCHHTLLGQTLDGQDLDLLKITLPGDGKARKQCWIIARQHPGETMAEWWMEGCLEALLGPERTQSASLLELCDLYLVPNMNPDGSRRGHLRTNAAGRNLNREWADPSLAASPEVYLVKQAMQATGVDFLLDVHGDESLPYCFIAGTEGLIDWSEADQASLDFYRNTLAALNPDFQTEHGYPPKPRGEANLTMSTGQIASIYHCLAMTLEMPFKDTTATPDPQFGWSPLRCKALAHSCLEALETHLRRQGQAI